MMPSTWNEDELRQNSSAATTRNPAQHRTSLLQVWAGIEFCPVPALLLDPTDGQARWNQAYRSSFSDIPESLPPQLYHIPGTTIPLLARDFLSPHRSAFPVGIDSSASAGNRFERPLTWIGESRVGNETRIIEVTAFSIRGSDGAPLGAVQYMRDRSDEQGFQAGMARCQKTEILATMTATMAHQFNNSLMVLQGYIDLMLERIGNRLADPLVTSLLKLDSSCRDAIHMTRGILEFARHHRFRRIPVDLHVLLITMRDFLRILLPGRITLDIAPSSAPVRTMGDPDLLKHAILNLVTNARDAIPGEGRIAISIRNVESLTNRVQDGPAVSIMVEDSGRGIPEEIQHRIFEASFTTRENGNGLGLFAVRRIVESHGGEVRIQGTGPSGTRFEIILPALLSTDEDNAF